MKTILKSNITMPKIILICLILFSSFTIADTQNHTIPEPLKDWIPWVLETETTKDCPWFYNRAKTACRWPSQLTLNLTDKGGEFEFYWLTYRKQWLTLVGETQWPQNVKINQETATVITHKGRPSIYVDAGYYQVTGEFQWAKLPVSLSIPQDIGLLTVTVNGKPLTNLNRDNQGKLWLKQKITQKKQTNQLQLRVYRHLNDMIPMRMTTRIELDVSGDNREITLGPIFDENWRPLVLNSPLPSHLDKNGELKLQVRAGQWVIIVKTRNTKPLAQLSLPKLTQQWVAQEIWSFQAQHRLRLVELQGARQIDPQQTTLPQQWKQFPSYLVTPETQIQIIEKRRGDSNPQPNQLDLKRELFLDFSGQGMTIQDHITGNMYQSWRLNMPEPLQLGRVTLNNQEQFITQLAPNQPAGVEIREGRVELTADSRLEGDISQLSAVGWQHDFQNLATRLHLPPGWRLLHASGMDTIEKGTLLPWLQHWKNLLDLFVVLLITIACAKLWGWQWGLFALVTMILIYHEPNAPKTIWLIILASIALSRVVPTGQAKTLIRFVQRGSLLVLILIILPFIIQQARQAIYPQLEKPWKIMVSNKPESPQARYQIPQQSVVALDSVKETKQTSRYLQTKKPTVATIDPNAQIQTGPGLPQWRWNTVNFHWNGRVQAEQTIKLWLIPPNISAILSFVQVLFVLVLLIKMLDIKFSNNLPKIRKKPVNNTSKAVILLFALLLLLPYSNPSFAEYPSPELLQQLKQRLLPTPTCFPQCADIANMQLVANNDQLKLTLEVHSDENIAFPLPGKAKEWLAEQVFVNQQPATGLFQYQQQLWLQLNAGVHTVELQGRLPRQNKVPLYLGLKPHQLQVELTGWDLQGWQLQGQIEQQLLLQRQHVQTSNHTKLQPTRLPSFVEVERVLKLGLIWEVDTYVQRIGNDESPIVMAIPLLAGESVITDNIRVKNQQVLVNLPAYKNHLQWHSNLEISDTINLTATNNQDWIEKWRLEINPLWHPTISGIPVVQHQNAKKQWQPQWQPWQNESVTIKLQRPQGIQGATFTIDHSILKMIVSQRSLDSQLQLTIRSSQGGQYQLQLPPNASLQQVKINQRLQPIRQEQQTVTLPLKPGKQTFDLSWQQPQTINTNLQSPKLNLAHPSVNAETIVQLPKNRWLLWVDGPNIGPAILFWGVLIVILVIAIALGQTAITPLKTYHWILLALGLTTTTIESALLIIFWLFALGWRQQIKITNIAVWKFNLYQIALVLLSLVALSSLFYAIQQGLLATPDMSIVGNGSTSDTLQWYQDRSQDILPTVTIISLPLLVYKLLMLCWALWLAFALLNWLKWGWACFSKGEYWMKPEILRKK